MIIIAQLARYQNEYLLDTSFIHFLLQLPPRLEVSLQGRDETTYVEKAVEPRSCLTALFVASHPSNTFHSALTSVARNPRVDLMIRKHRHVLSKQCVSRWRVGHGK
jgi:hypothetical protein